MRDAIPKLYSFKHICTSEAIEEAISQFAKDTGNGVEIDTVRLECLGYYRLRQNLGSRVENSIDFKWVSYWEDRAPSILTYVFDKTVPKKTAVLCRGDIVLALVILHD